MTLDEYKRDPRQGRESSVEQVQFYYSLLLFNMRASSLFVLALPLLAVASAVPRQSDQCNTGSLQCCQSVQSSDSSVVSVLLGLLGVVLGGVNVPIGVTCSPISVVGVGGNSCTADPVCCENNSFNGVIAIGCTPITLGL